VFPPVSFYGRLRPSRTIHVLGHQIGHRLYRQPGFCPLARVPRLFTSTGSFFRGVGPRVAPVPSFRANFGR
jgi:hypothetical protein